MKRSVQKANATTQRFTQIEDIVNEIVLLSGNQASLVMEVTSTNFALQSPEEQQSKIYSYAALLNSLSFPIQVLIISRKLDVSSYIHRLDMEASRTQNQSLANQIKMYKEFVSQLVSVNTVLDKKFYVAIYYSILEKGAKGVTGSNRQNFLIDARSQLRGKSESVSEELLRAGLKSKVLESEELIKLFYEIYNPESGASGAKEAK